MNETTLEVQECEDGTVFAEGEHDPAVFLEAARRQVGGLEDVVPAEVHLRTWWRCEVNPDGGPEPYYLFNPDVAERDNIPGRLVRVTFLDG